MCVCVCVCVRVYVCVWCVCVCIHIINSVVTYRNGKTYHNLKKIERFNKVLFLDALIRKHI